MPTQLATEEDYRYAYEGAKDDCAMLATELSTVLDMCIQAAQGAVPLSELSTIAQRIKSTSFYGDYLIAA